MLHIGDFSVSTSIAKTRDFKAFLWDKAQFVLISVFTFVLSYLALNYQSIYQNIQYKWQVSKGVSMPQFEILRDTAQTSQASTLTVGPTSQPSQQPSQQTNRQTSPNMVAKLQASLLIPQLTLPIHPPDTRVVIPRILKNIPVIGVGNSNLIARDWDALEKDIQEALRNGVVHYPGTALPGESGNVVITGHSSFYAWDAGRFKDVFGLLHEVKPKDKIFLFHNQKKYTYEVFDIRVVKPTEIDVLGHTKDERLTLITCTPLGTNLKRLIVTAKRV